MQGFNKFDLLDMSASFTLQHYGMTYDLKSVKETKFICSYFFLLYNLHRSDQCFAVKTNLKINI